MGYVDDAFAKLKSQLETTKSENSLAKKKHEEIRSHVEASWDLDSEEPSFLTGSYRRHTKTKKLKDVDIFVVIDPNGAQGHLRDKPSSATLNALLALLEEKFDDVAIDGMACTIGADDEEIVSFDVVGAFKRKAGGYEIPDGNGGWLATNPKTHHELSTAKNEMCGGKYVPFVKMIKGANREMDEPVEPSFLLEVMALDLVNEPFGRYQDEVAYFLADAVERLDDPWPDPAGLGPDVNTMTSSQRSSARAQLEDAHLIAERAIWLEDDGQERAAYDEWRKLFGWRMPRPS